MLIWVCIVGGFFGLYVGLDSVIIVIIDLEN